MKRRTRLVLLAGYLASGGLVLQLGPVCTLAGSTATTGAASSGVLIDDNGNFLGLFNVCGQPDVLIVDENGVPGDLLNTADDLMLGCPIRQITVVGGGGGGGGGGDGGGGNGGGGNGGGG